MPGFGVQYSIHCESFYLYTLHIEVLTVYYMVISIISFHLFFLFYRDFNLTEKLDYSSAVALLGYSLILSILRVFNVKDEASRVMYAAPVLAFVTTHILYLNFYDLDYG